MESRSEQGEGTGPYTINVDELLATVQEQGAFILQNAAHTQYRVQVSCPVCEQLTEWVEAKGDLFRMQLCGHEVRGVRRRVRVDENGFLRVDADPS